LAPGRVAMCTKLVHGAQSTHELVVRVLERIGQRRARLNVVFADPVDDELDGFHKLRTGPMISPPVRRSEIVAPESILVEVLEPRDACSGPASQKLMPAPHLDTRLVEATVARVPSLPINDHLLERFGELLPGANFTEADTCLIKEALTVKHQVAKQ